jgi:hypothetical protein
MFNSGCHGFGVFRQGRAHKWAYAILLARNIISGATGDGFASPVSYRCVDE